jgi:hypothetical protein
VGDVWSQLGARLASPKWGREREGPSGEFEVKDEKGRATNANAAQPTAARVWDLHCVLESRGAHRGLQIARADQEARLMAKKEHATSSGCRPRDAGARHE